MQEGLEIRERNPNDLPVVEGLLNEAGLPLDGLDRTHGWVALADGQLLGHVALEKTESGAVLRSLVVAPSARQRGIGAALLRRAELECSGCVIFLRTRSISDWVQRLGYERVSPEAVPEPVRDTVEFSGSICASVPIFRKTLRSV